MTVGRLISSLPGRSTGCATPISCARIAGACRSRLSVAKEMHGFLLELHAQVRPLSEAAAEQARERYRRILSEAEREEPPPQTGKGRPKNTPGRNLLRRLKEQEECSLAFALVEGVPFDEQTRQNATCARPKSGQK